MFVFVVEEKEALRFALLGIYHEYKHIRHSTNNGKFHPSTCTKSPTYKQSGEKIHKLFEEIIYTKWTEIIL